MRRPSPSLRLVQFCFFIFDFDLDEDGEGSAEGTGEGEVVSFEQGSKSKSLEVLQGVRAGATFSS